ncbi:MAG: hypothetical protein R2854_14455 [Caldilineaceae bacterium]
MLPTDMDDNTLMVLDFGGAFFGFVYGVAAGGLPNMGQPLIFGTDSVINGSNMNGQPISTPGRVGRRVRHERLTAPRLRQAQGDGESHVYEDVMRTVDWIWTTRPPVATAEHAATSSKSSTPPTAPPRQVKHGNYGPPF